MILVAWSGGLDSTYLIWSHLQHSRCVLAFYWRVMPSGAELGQLWRAQSAATLSLLPILESPLLDARAGLLSASLRSPPGDIVWVTRHLAFEVATGRLPMVSSYAWGSRADETSRGVPERRLRAKSVWASAFKSSDRRAPPVVCPSISISRREIWDTLPPAIRERTITCRRPIAFQSRWKSCGKCHTCRETIAAGIPIERDLPVEV